MSTAEAMTDIVTQMITDLGSVWDNTNITGISTDIVMTHIDDVVEDPDLDMDDDIEDPGIIAFGNQVLETTTEYAGFANEEYTIPIAFVMVETSNQAFKDSCKELVRAAREFNSTGTKRRYFVHDFTLPGGSLATETRDSGAFITARIYGVKTE